MPIKPNRNLKSPLREIRTAGSKRGDEHKRHTAPRLVPTHPFPGAAGAARLAGRDLGSSRLSSRLC